jgi:DNA-binding NarL/FixJ family response regulator
MAHLRKKRVLLADDHPVVTTGLQRLLEPRCAAVSVVSSIPALWQMLHEGRHDLCVLDLNFGRESALASLPKFRARWPAVAFVVLTAHGEALRAAAMHAGAAGFVDKSASPDILLAVLAEVAGGRAADMPNSLLPSRQVLAKGTDTGMTPRQAELMSLLLTGATQVQAAATMGVSVATVEYHLRELRSRTGIRRMPLLLEWARVKLAP